METGQPAPTFPGDKNPEEVRNKPASSNQNKLDRALRANELDEDSIDGGSIQNLQSSYNQQPPGYHSEVRQEGQRRSWIAATLFILLAAIICGHYCVIAVFAWNGKSDVKSLETAFNTALPVIAGLTGTAAAFYFKARK